MATSPDEETPRADGESVPEQSPTIPQADPEQQQPLPDDVPAYAIPRRAKIDQYLDMKVLQGRITKYASSQSALSWIAPFLRTENINVHTTFPRKRKFLKWRGKLALAVLVVVFAVSLWFMGWYILVQTVILGVPVVVAVLATIVRLPQSGRYFQQLKQVLGSRSWLLDMYSGLNRPPGVQIRLSPILAAYFASGGIGLATNRLQWWFLPLSTARSIAIAAASFLVMLWMYLMWLDRVARNLGRNRFPALPEQVHRLSMVQALSWTTLAGYPEEPKSHQVPLFFVSTFNEAFDGYVGGFVEGMEQSLGGPWGEAPGFPQVKDGFRQFLEYVDRASFPLEHSFVAYPHCSVVDVRNALAVDRSLRSFQVERQGQAVSAANHQQFLARVRLALPSIPRRVALADGPQLEVPAGVNDELLSGQLDPGTASRQSTANSHTSTTILVSVLPIGKGKADEVRLAIRELGGGFPELDGAYAHAESPFNRVKGTHFARLTVIAPWKDDDNRSRSAIWFEQDPPGKKKEDLQPEHAWLFFSAQFDTHGGESGAKDWLARLHDVLGANVDEIWGKTDKSVAWSDRAAFAGHIIDNSEEPVVRMVDHPENTVWDVLRSLRSHRLVSGHLAAKPNSWHQDIQTLALGALTEPAP